MRLRNTQNETQKLTVLLATRDKERAKRIAKRRGMTFQGWLGGVVKEAIDKEAAHEP